MKTNIGNVMGIVAEYNPFHNGHKYQLKECKRLSEADYVVAVMSGNFTQRGEPALLDKWKRAEMALRGGVDLVIELPTFYALNGADKFAEGAIKSLNYLGCVTHLAFGSESGNIESLRNLSKLRMNESDEFKKCLRSLLKEGVSYSKALRVAIGNIYGYKYGEILTSNNILALEYIMSSERIGCNFEYVTVKRDGEDHNNIDTCNGNAFDKSWKMSGQSIRKSLKTIYLKQDNCIDENLYSLSIPKSSVHIIRENIDEAWLDDWYRINNLLRYHALCSDRKLWKNKPSWEEGLEGKFINEIRTSSPSDIVDKLISKRYSRSRIQKYILQVLMNIEKDSYPKEYVRVLGFNNKGSELLRKIKKLELAKADIITNVAKSNILPEIDIRATDFYNLILKRDVYKNSDFVKQPVILS